METHTKNAMERRMNLFSPLNDKEVRDYTEKRDNSIAISLF